MSICEGCKKSKKLTFFIFAYWYDPRWKKFVGATVKVLDLANNIATNGHQVILFLPKYNYKDIEAPFKIVEIPLVNLPIVRFVSYNIFLLFYLIIFLFKKRPDVIYMRRMNSIIPALFAKLYKAKFIFEVNDDPYEKVYQEGSISLFRFRSKFSILQDEINLKFCDKAIIITKALAKKILKMYPELKATKILIIPSGANTQLFTPLEKKKCRIKLGLDPEIKIIGFAGSLLKHQGIDILIDAAPSIINHEQDVVFIVIGEGPMKIRWKDKVNKRGLKNDFLFTGQIDYLKMPLWIASMDVCVAPFLHSTGFRSPAKIFDYFACGRPVVASRISGTTDIFLKSKAIKLVEPEEPDILADTIKDLIHNKREVASMSKNGRLFIEKNFSRCDIAKKIINETKKFSSL